MNSMTFRLPVFILALLYWITATAQVPRTIAFQGSLSGVADGNVTVTLLLYDALTGGTSLWSETKTVVVKKGLFSTALGSATAFPTTVTFDKQYFLGVKVGTDTEMMPRIALQSAPYALALPGVTALTTGNVGIGAALPSEKLTVTGGHVQIDVGKVFGCVPSRDTFTYGTQTMPEYGLGWFNDSWYTGSATGWLSGYGGLKLFTGAQPQVAITQSGNVGIGTTTPTSRLTIAGNAMISSTGTAQFIVNNPSYGTVYLEPNSIANYLISMNATATSSRDCIFAGHALNNMGQFTVKANNSLFSGNASVQHGIALDQGNVNNGSNLTLGLTFGTGGGEGILSKRTADGWASGDLEFFTNGIRRLVIANNGRIGIGTVTPEATLDVFDGDIRCKTLTLTSSRRFKDNIEPIQNPLATIMKLQGVTYSWKPEQGGKPDIGFIAEDVAQILPELVTMEADGVNAKGMDYSHLVALAIEGIKAQQRRIVVLEARNKALETRLARLEVLVSHRKPGVNNPR